MHHRHRDDDHPHRGRGERFARGESRPGFLGGERGERPGHHGGRRGGRMFDHGELRLVVLALIAEQPRHGYEIIKAIEERLAGSYSPSPGVIYPTLTMLEELGQATVAEAGGKKQYAITEAGQAVLSENRAAVDAALARIQAVGTLRGSSGAPQILRAMENLKLALRLRMDRGPLTEAQLRLVAEALDAAAVAVERS
jgi:DNA-binding PadR family transcriptional regulator